MKRKEALQQLNLGETVAEFDKDLSNYFIVTETFRSLILGEKDIVAGDKGTGKTALFKFLAEKNREIPELSQVEVVPAFNTTGDPIFQQLAVGGKILNEGQYRTVWKTYVLSLGGNWLLELYDGEWTPSMTKLDVLLRRIDLRASDDTPSIIFTRLVALVRRLTTPKSVGLALSFDEAGFPVTTPQVEFDNPEPENEKVIIRHSESLGLLNDALQEANTSLWLALDRLDEAFTGYPSTEIPALRALFRTYLDLLEFDRIKLKMFVRKDLFRKVTQGPTGFVNLTHINAKKIEIVWDDDDLLNLLIQRVRTNKQFMKTAELEGRSNTEIFDALFPDQVEEGTRMLKTFPWMLSRIRDGQDVKPPRNLIDLVKKAQEEQLRREDRDSHDFIPGQPLFEPEAIRKAQTRLSKARVIDTLLAESGNFRDSIERFKDGKAEHNFESLQRTLNLPEDLTKATLRLFVEMGFLERIRQSETYGVPFLYRDGLNITQGNAFQSPLGEQSDEEENS